jgi:hypothetical protein
MPDQGSTDRLGKMQEHFWSFTYTHISKVHEYMGSYAVKPGLM